MSLCLHERQSYYVFTGQLSSFFILQRTELYYVFVMMYFHYYLILKCMLAEMLCILYLDIHQNTSSIVISFRLEDTREWRGQAC